MIIVSNDGKIGCIECDKITFDEPGVAYLHTCYDDMELVHMIPLSKIKEIVDKKR